MTFTKVVLLTILPTAPRDPADFKNDLQGLNIDLYDLTVQNNKDGIHAGSATNVEVAPVIGPIEIVPRQTNPPASPRLKTAILQHFLMTTDLLTIPVITSYSVATAVVVLNIDLSNSEYDALDLRLVVTRNGNAISTTTLPVDFNSPVRSVEEPLSTDPAFWIALDYDGADPSGNPPLGDAVYRAGYVFVPPVPKNPPTGPTLEFAQDGVTPKFDSLVAIVNEVLVADHTSTDPDTSTSLETRATPLTTPQCVQVAKELIYNRSIYPLPQPQKQTLEDMYSNPKVNDQNDQNRKQFEANVTAYFSQHDAQATQLSDFIFSVSCAIQCEKVSIAQSTTSLWFQVVSNPNEQEPYVTKQIGLQGVVTSTNPEGYLTPTFGVPAAFFYALSFNLPSQLDVKDRLMSAFISSEAANLKKLQAAVDAGIIAAKESASTNLADAFLQNLNIAQAARRFVSLGPYPAMLTMIKLDTSVSDLVSDFLNYSGVSAALGMFWTGESTSQASQYLEVILSYIAAEKSDVKQEIRTAFGISTVAQLASISDDSWRHFWVPAPTSPTDSLPAHRASLLPNYTIPGSAKQRTEAFIRFLLTLFSVDQITHIAADPTPETIPSLDLPAQDILGLFFNAAPTFTFSTPIDEVAVQSTLESIQVSDKLKAWAVRAIKVIGFLFTVTTFTGSDQQTATRQFALMEGLYSRGFITPERVAVLEKSQFHAAVAGSVAYYTTESGKLVSDLIYDIAEPLATGVPSLGPEAGNVFSPINPGNLVDCIPPKYLSPFSLNMYLKRLLLLEVTTDSGTQSIAAMLQSRRGILGSLQVSEENSDICVPLIDTANETLESIVEQAAAGNITGPAIYNTDIIDVTELGYSAEDAVEIDSSDMLAACPQHSSPNLPNPPTAAYDILKHDYSSPELPYDQEMDINRTLLNYIRTSRFEVMRTFRSDISAFALNATEQPAEFRTMLWRYPVEPSIALEYLTISETETELFFNTVTDTSKVSTLYGFSPNDEDWEYELSSLDTFLKKIGLTYCQFYELWETRYLDISRYSAQNSEGERTALPFLACEPCCLKPHRLVFGSPDGGESVSTTANTRIVLYQTAIFIRLWRKVEKHYGDGRVSLKAFASICQVLRLFDSHGAIMSQFTYQLACFFMLCDNFCLPMCLEYRPRSSSEESASETASVDYYLPILGIWTDTLPDSGSPQAAIQLLLKGVECHAMATHGCDAKGAHFRKLLRENLSDLSSLFGFTSDIPWNATPSCTLRFAEILSKIFASPYTVGELFFLFTTWTHLEGDDPYPWTEPDESRVDPLNVPEDDTTYGLWALRKKLLCVKVDQDAENAERCNWWTWNRIVESLRDDFDFKDHAALTTLSEHFFPCVLEEDVPPSKSRFRVSLQSYDTNPTMWNSPPCEPFHYSQSMSELWAQLPLRDEDVLTKLFEIRQLKDNSQTEGKSEVQAIKEVYYQPRALLAPFAVIFGGGDISGAIQGMVEEECEEARFKFFQESFAVFHRRCKVLAEHLAGHVRRYTESESESECCSTEDDKLKCKRSMKLAWNIIKRLIADENLPENAPWENDTGTSPDPGAFTWEPRLSGSAFSALLGLVGTGLVGNFQVGSDHITWQEIRNTTSAFGAALDKENIPVPMNIPNLMVQPSPAESQILQFRNGFVVDDTECPSGAQSFKVEWEGILVVENDGCYRFSPHRPQFDQSHRAHHAEVAPHGYGECHDHCDPASWLVKLSRGKRHWLVLQHGSVEEDTTRLARSSVPLTRGAYEITIQFEQPMTRSKDVDGDEHVNHVHTGFGVLYSGPDTDDCSIFIQKKNLYIKSKDRPLEVPRGLEGSSVEAFQAQRYFSTLRDIRRTYQRAFKAMLFAYRFRLSVDPLGACQGISELDYMVEHPANFSGAAYYPCQRPPLTTEKYLTHLANFDFNFLPVDDSYYPPDRNRDNRAGPSPQRTAAMADWWERTYDYTSLRHTLAQRQGPRYEPLCKMFFQALTEDLDAVSLVRQLGIELDLSELVLAYFENKTINSAYLEDERWPIRVFQSWRLVKTFRKILSTRAIHDAQPELWASNSPSTTLNHGDPQPQRTGNQNLIYCIKRTLIADQDTPNYGELKKLNDCLRLRAHDGLIAYLCGMDRVPLSNTGDNAETAKVVSDLATLLLQDLDTGLCQKASRLSEAVFSVQKLVQRVCLGLEPNVSLSDNFKKQWETVFGSAALFQAYAKRVIYSENWIQWFEAEAAGSSDAAEFLSRSLDAHGLNVPQTSPALTWPENRTNSGSCVLNTTQFQVFGRLDTATGAPDEGIGLMCFPTRSAQRTLLSATEGIPSYSQPDPQSHPRIAMEGDIAAPVSQNQPRIPMWFQAAVRMGTSFIRVAAAGPAPAMCHSWDDSRDCMCRCGKVHAPEVDEYYFWLEKGQYFDSVDAIADATLGVKSPNPTTDWERDDKLPKLLLWPKKPKVYLQWTQIHYNELSPPRRSTQSIPYDGITLPTLTFDGRQQDSLVFSVPGLTFTGFRYDLATNTAVATPQIVPNVFPTTVVAGLVTYPFFAYFTPGQPVFPVSTLGSSLAIAAKLRSECKFDEALKWCRSTFDTLQRDNTWAQCRREQSVRAALTVLTSDVPESTSEEERTHLMEQDGPCCPTGPVQVNIARARAVTMDYIRTLIQWATSLHCSNTTESFKQALSLFDEAIRLLGPRPCTIQSKVNKNKNPVVISSFVPASAPLNPALLQLYETVYDQRDLMQRCLGPQRLKQSLHCSQVEDSFGCLEMDSCGCDAGRVPCCLPYKFMFSLSKAYELTSTAKALGQSLMSAMEKGDAEYLASFRQAQERQLNELAMSNKQDNYRESDWQVQAIDQQLQGAQTRLRYNQQLLQNGLNSGETAFLSGTTVAMESRTAANVSEGVGQGMSFIPDFTMGGAGFGGSPVSIFKLPLGSKLAQVFQAAARIMNVLGDISNTNATVSSTSGGWERRSDEWRHQVDVITIELAQIKRQQLAAERRRALALKDLNNHQVQIENSAEVDAFLADKFTKHDLYLFLQQDIAGLYRRTFDLAWQYVLEAKASLKRERRDLAHQVDTLLPARLGPVGWDNLRQGLMAGERLEAGLHSLERMYLSQVGCREYELGKFISLRLHFPLAFLQLKMVGWCEFEIPEWMFDLDYPGHYLRRIKNVAITIPCIVGPYVSVNCRLQLLSSGTRLHPTLPVTPKCCCKSENKCIGPLHEHDPCNSWVARCDRPSALQPTCISAYEQSDAFSRDFLPIEAIATSSGQNDSGLFELSFRDDKLRAPFEFAGAAASRWRVELPPHNNSFDPDSITDLVLHMNYIAKEGGPALREVAESAAWNRLPGDGVRFIDVRSEFPTTWYPAFVDSKTKSHVDKCTPQKHHHRHGRRAICLPLRLGRQSFPFITGRRDVIVTSIDLFIDVANPCKMGTHFGVEFIPKEGFPDDVKAIACTSSGATPGFFHGAVHGLHIGPLSGNQPEDLATLKFPEDVRDSCVRDMYFLCHYEAVNQGC